MMRRRRSKQPTSQKDRLFTFSKEVRDKAFASHQDEKETRYSRR